jgi:hypothetical protein
MALAQYADLFRGRRVFSLNRSATYAIGTGETIPFAGILSMDRGAEFPLIAEHLATRILCWDPVPGARIAQPDEAIEHVLPALASSFHAWLAESSPPAALWCPRLCRSAWHFAEDHGLVNLCPQPALTAWLRDKQNVLPALASIGIPILEGAWIQPSSDGFGPLRNRFGLPFVVQTNTSDSGLGTTIVHREADLYAAFARAGSASLWAARFASNLSMNINACVTAQDVFVAYPSVQLTGLSFGLAAMPRYCGNDYAATKWLPATAVRDLSEQTHRIGVWLLSLGYRGIFGLDFVMDNDGRFHPVDLNPRWQGSTALLAQAQSIEGQVPLPVLSIADQLDLLPRAELVSLAAPCAQPIEASQFFLHSPAAPTRCAGAPLPGVYELGESLRWHSSGCHLRDLPSSRHLLAGGGVPEAGTLLAPSIPILRVFRRGPVLQPDLTQHQPWAAHAANALYAHLQLTEIAGAAPAVATGSAPEPPPAPMPSAPSH